MAASLLILYYRVADCIPPRHHLLGIETGDHFGRTSAEAIRSKGARRQRSIASARASTPSGGAKVPSTSLRMIARGPIAQSNARVIVFAAVCVRSIQSVQATGTVKPLDYQPGSQSPIDKTVPFSMSAVVHEFHVD